MHLLTVILSINNRKTNEYKQNIKVSQSYNSQ